ncbi:MAG: hypothetical protein QM790_00505 [Nibricoccus sp.]
MSATVFLATDDPDLLRLWWAAVPNGRSVVTFNNTLPLPLPAGVPVVVVLDAASGHLLPVGLEKCPTIFVGEPGSMPFDQARATGRARVLLSYEESRTRLREFLPLVEEIAERSAAVEVMAEKARRSEGSRPPMKVGNSSSWSDATQVWEFLEAAVESISSRQQLLAEFRRSARNFLHASYVLFFLRDGDVFKSDRGDHSCLADDALIAYLSKHPAILDGAEWPGSPDPMAEMAVRHRLMLWSARLIVPVHDNGRILGLMALGVRDDGQAYDVNDRSRLVFFARLLRQFLTRSGEVDRLVRQQERWKTGQKYFPNLLILDPEENAPRDLPLIVRTVAGEVKQSHENKCVLPTAHQPYRVSGGIISETGSTWICWEDASAELRERNHHERLDRLALLHDLALTLNHELGNSLVSLIALRHNPGSETNSPVLLAAIKRDIANLETINRHLASIPTFREVDPEPADLRMIMRQVGEKTSVAVDTGPQAILLNVVPMLIEFALQAIIESIVENRPEFGRRGLSVQLRAAGEGDQLTALIGIQGEKLELEGVLPVPEPGDIPSHGRIGVFIAKEIVRLHGGEIHSGPGADDSEISISIRSW